MNPSNNVVIDRKLLHVLMILLKFIKEFEKRRREQLRFSLVAKIAEFTANVKEGFNKAVFLCFNFGSADLKVLIWGSLVALDVSSIYNLVSLIS